MKNEFVHLQDHHLPIISDLFKLEKLGVYICLFGLPDEVVTLTYANKYDAVTLERMIKKFEEKLSALRDMLKKDPNRE